MRVNLTEDEIELIKAMCQTISHEFKVMPQIYKPLYDKLNVATSVRFIQETDEEDS